ncbi:S8 family peptidase [Mucilaginibacter polytrichastri]|uniref:Peptidase S8/S53 domain-containing protein n=1 Tax=Mucilaginibacter polytrichastri TaxID=1302689 RepID=A0A1Q5ZYV2_9SPHI|nr:S8 family peptidase [Mucilaginibacter polytrichastri]OKS86950.1 hypothetical protein RG47T_2408 [Mucilaginibacter polytrichastri]SFS84839.1 Por secretion system C-terminal sorting domain-containing protein [Mucilaginibacter polytrichastri]
MIKKILFLIIFICYCKLAWAQKVISDKIISNIYQATSINKLQSSNKLNYYLVKFKEPKYFNVKNAHLVKRISYNHYIVSSTNAILPNENTISIAPANASWKASDNLLQLWQKHPGSNAIIEVAVNTKTDSVINDIKIYGNITTQAGNVITINIGFQNLAGLLQQPYITFANTARKPHEELAISDIDLGANNIGAIADSYADINGTGINVSVKEDKYDDDLDLLGRSFNSFPTAGITSGHATTMATLIGGNGNSYIKGSGAAPKARFTSSNFANLMPDSIATFKSYHISVQNHSYGTGIENYYGTEAVAYDKQINENDSIIHVFSSGNVGTSTPETGLYNGIAGFANLSGSFKQAKNVLVVGGTGRTNLPEDLSSAGPAYDGRIKPELVADGEDGTSGAAALVSGTVALLQQSYQKQFHQLPSAALIKSVLINSADDIGAPNVDYKTGYGKLNALEALRTINEVRFVKGTVSNQQQMDYTITVPAGCSTFKISLAWNDLPAALNAPTALINDLDLTVTTPAGEIVLPWALSIYPAADSLAKPAQRQRDAINNTEQITLQNPIAGNYILHVKGSNIPAGTQTFYAAYQAIIADHFEWIYPSGNNALFADDDNYIRWQNSFNTSSGKLSVSYDHGATWKPVSDITLKNNYYTWTTPDVFTTAILKMDINGQPQMSKEFSLSKPLNLNVGYNCTTGTLLHWALQPGSKGYNIYTIKNNSLQQLTTTTDTTVIIPIQQQSTSYFAVSAIGDGFEGIKSYTIDANNQGVGCYIKTLLANLANNTILLNLQIGSIVNLKSIAWEKMTGPDLYTTLGTTPITSTALAYNFTDANPKKGIQYYRATLTTGDNQIIYSDIASIIFLQSSQFTVYPNPVSTQLTILSGDINNYDFKLYDINGRVSFDKSITELQNKIPLNVMPGVYVYVISLNGKILYKGKLIKI